LEVVGHYDIVISVMGDDFSTLKKLAVGSYIKDQTENKAPNFLPNPAFSS